MSAAKQSSKRTVIGVSLHPHEIATLDAQRSKLRINGRGSALKVMWRQFGDDAVDAALQRGAEADAKATDLAVVLAPLVDAMHALDAAWAARAGQRQSIGVHTNQIAKLANVLSVMARTGEPIPADDVERIANALESIDRRMSEQLDAERSDDVLRATARGLLDRFQGPA